MNQNIRESHLKKGSANIMIIVVGIIILTVIVGYFISNKRIISPVNIPPTSPVPSSISQLTIELVLNGFDQCGVQFKNGDFSLSNSEFERIDAEKLKMADPFYDAWIDGCDASSGFSEDNIIITDLDGDGINEALVPARVVRVSSGGVLYVFKNLNEKAQVITREVFGKGNVKVIAVNGNTIVVEYVDPMTADGLKTTEETYQFLNGKLIKK